MRDLDSARKSWQSLKQYETLRELKDAVRLDGQTSTATEGCRSACWKAFLIFDTLDLAEWQKTLSSSRSAYNSVRSHFLRHLENPEELEAGYDPLSEDTEASPWTQLRKDEELRAEILQDVARCMPENLYFRQPETQRILLDILFIFCKLNPDVSYRQGMHELLAPILWVVERDAIEIGGSSKTMGEDAIIKNVFDGEHIEHDCFTLFGQVMQSAKNFYEQTTVHGKENPIVNRSKRIFNELLPKVDVQLARHLESIDIVPQVFLMRWIRLLFGREFGFDEMLTVWDVIFAEDPTFEIVDEICVAMILRIRWELIEADYNTALTLLLRYPEVDQDYPPQTLALDGLYVREHMDLHGGSYLVTKYTGKPPTGRPITPPALQRNITAVSGPNLAKTAVSSSSRLSASNLPAMPGAARNIEAVFQSTAKSIYARSEKLGIGKAVRSAVDEVHKRAQEIRDAQTPSPPVMYRQRGSRSSLGPMALQNRIRALEDRSRQLSKLLEGAVSELWEYQKQIADKNESYEKAENTDEVEQLSVAIAKVQFVQVYLDDPKLPLPEETSQTDKGVESGSSSMIDTESRQKERVSKKQVDMPPSTNKPTFVFQSQPPPTSQTGTEDLADPSSFEDDEFAETSPLPEKPASEVLFDSEAQRTYFQDDYDGLSETRETSGSRPRLDQSSFSWMLGDEDTSTPSFSSSTPLPPDQKRNKGFLFGEGSVSGDSKDAGRRRGSDKSRKTSAGVVLTTENEGFDLGSFRHGKK